MESGARCVGLQFLLDTSLDSSDSPPELLSSDELDSKWDQLCGPFILYQQQAKLEVGGHLAICQGHCGGPPAVWTCTL